jgi:hypothetical protein
VVWGSTFFDPTELILQTPWANFNGKLNWDSPIDLDGANRTIDVQKDHNNTRIGGVNNEGAKWNDGYAQISRSISNSDVGMTAGLV